MLMPNCAHHPGFARLTQPLPPIKASLVLDPIRAAIRRPDRRKRSRAGAGSPAPVDAIGKTGLPDEGKSVQLGGA